MFIILVFALISRLQYGKDNLLSGDEIGVSVVQAVGKWDAYATSLPVNKPVDFDQLRDFYTYSGDHPIGDVLTIMRNDRLHPPLYFAILHFALALFGTNIFIIRLLSIAFSLISIVGIFLLGRLVFNEKTGIIAVLFMALSPYCLEYSVMVRLYPLEMMLSILSTYLLALMIKRDLFHFRSIHLYLYILTAVAGLYTYYSFSVIILSQIFFVILCVKPEKTKYVTAVFVYVIIFALLIPWVIPFFQGLGQVHDKDLYFKGSYSVVFIFQYFAHILYFPFMNVLWKDNSGIDVFLTGGVTLIILTVCFYGNYRAIKDRFSRNFIISVFFYLLVFLVNDKVFSTNTMTFDRQHYYSVPVLILFLASGVAYFSQNQIIRGITLAFITLLLSTGFYFRQNHKSVFDGPYYFTQFNEQLQRHCNTADPSKVLILYNCKDKRYVLPLVQYVKGNYNMMIVPKGINDSILGNIQHAGKYQNVVIANVEVSERKRKRLELELIDDRKTNQFLLNNGFRSDGIPYSFQYEEKLTMTFFRRSDSKF